MTSEVTTQSFKDRVHLMHKSVGWMLRKAGNQEMTRPERFPKEKRKSQLEATRG